MPLTRPTFFGASVSRINSAIGWGSQGSSLDVTVVEDPTNGDSFTATSSSIGAPAYFSIGSYAFNGILRKFTRDKSTNGYPTYNVQLVDPRSLLESTKVILSDYRLSVTGIYNLINVFGYWENVGYGNSQANDTGMPWQLVRTGLTNIINNPAGSWGGPITYRGYSYSIDLSDMPSLPIYFRVGGQGHGLSILEFIQTCCDAANYDFFIKLVGTTITLVTVPRVNTYPLGTMTNILESTFAGSVIRSSAGLEERNETTSVFLIGGNVQQLYKVQPSGAYPFWGFNSTGDIIVGGVDRHAVFYGTNPTTNSTGYQLYSYPVKEYTLYVPEISSIIGSTSWFTNDLELQVLLGLGSSRDTYGSWVEYLRKADPTRYEIINYSKESPNIQPNFRGATTPNNVTNTSRGRISDIQAAGRAAIAETGTMRLKLVYETLVKYARDYYGKKWALNIPGISRYTDPDTGVIYVSNEPSDGGFVGETDVNDLLGLPGYASDLFQTQDGRYIPYAVYNASGADLSRVNPGNSLIDGNNLYIKGKLHNQIYFYSGESFAVMELDPIYNYPDAVVGVSGLVGALIRATGINLEPSGGTITNVALDSNNSSLKELVKGQTQGSVPIVSHPAARIPSGYEVPLKSNVLTYGPWYAQGATGKVDYVQDNTLVPWNYNSYTNLNLAANAKATYGISYAQVVETGYVEVAGAPGYNLGDVIATSGSNITGISVGWGRDGVTTTYRFETFVPKFGDIGKYSVDRFQRMNIMGFKRTAELKALNRQRNLAVLAEAEANTALSLLATLPANVNIRTPSNALVSYMIQSSGGDWIHPAVSTTTFNEALGLIPTSGADYNNVTIGTMEQVISPYQTRALQNPSGNILPRFNEVGASGIWDDANVVNIKTLNPWKSSPSGWINRYYSRGEGAYEDINDYNYIGEDLSNKVQRSFGLRSPLVLCGWGFDKYGSPTHGGTSYLRDYSVSKVGPLDALWDNDRGVWTVHDIMNVTLAEDIPSGSGGSVQVYIKGSGGSLVTAYNRTSSTLSSGLQTQMGYVASDNRNYLLGGGGGSSNINVNGTGILLYGYHLIDAIDELYATSQLNFDITPSGYYYSWGDSPTFLVSISGTETSSLINLTLPSIIIDDANSNVPRGLVTNETQNIDGLKKFRNHIQVGSGTLIPHGVVPDVYYVTSPWELGRIADLTGGTYDPISNAWVNGFNTPVPSMDLVQRGILSNLYGISISEPIINSSGTTYYYGCDLQLRGPILTSGVPKYGIKIYGPSSIDDFWGATSYQVYGGGYGGVAGDTFYGVQTLGGLVISGTTSVPTSALPSGTDISGLLPSGFLATDYKFKITSTDTTPSFASDKIIGGSGIFVESANIGADEDLVIHSQGKVTISGNDTTLAHLENKVVGGSGISVQIINPGGDEDLQINLNDVPTELLHLPLPSGSVLGAYRSMVSVTDADPKYLYEKITPGSGVFIELNGPGGDEKLIIHGTFVQGSGDYKFKTTSADELPGYGQDKIINGNYVDVELVNTVTMTGLNQQLRVQASGIDHGTYSPSVTEINNLTSHTTYDAMFHRIGNIVTVTGRIDVTPTTIDTSTSLRISLPISSNFDSDYECVGVASSYDSQNSGGIIGDTSNKAALMNWITRNDTAYAMNYNFTYKIE